MAPEPVAIIDIGSNSIRLVVYSGATRTPSILFNEKVMAGLGRGVSETGRLREDDQERALMALRRFRLLTEQMAVRRIRVVATAAVREAENGAQFLDAIKDLGLVPEILSGGTEALMAGLGVISGIPGANGIVGDLGGGSLELVDISQGAVRHSVSLPLGVLRLAPLLARSETALVKTVRKALDGTDFAERGWKRPFYLVGGSWRALARLDMTLRSYPLPILHQYRMDPRGLEELRKAVGAIDRTKLENMPSLSTSRASALPQATLLLQTLVDAMRPSELIVSSYGIREGLLYADLDERARSLDPLIEAARDAWRGFGRFPEHGALLDRWIAPLFDEGAEAERLRLTACLLADVAWQAHPDFRAERGVDMALHGNWVGIDGPGRVMLAQALHCNFGGSGDFADFDFARLCSEADLSRACLWGLAMRLGQRLSGGVAAGLERSRLSIDAGMLQLEIQSTDSALYGESVERRLKTLASALRLKPQVRFV